MIVLLALEAIKQARSMRIPALSLTVMLLAPIMGATGAALAGGQSEEGQMTQPDAAEALAGKSWHLVQIMSIGDNTYKIEIGSDEIVEQLWLPPGAPIFAMHAKRAEYRIQGKVKGVPSGYLI